MKPEKTPAYRLRELETRREMVKDELRKPSTNTTFLNEKLRLLEELIANLKVNR